MTRSIATSDDAAATPVVVPAAKLVVSHEATRAAATRAAAVRSDAGRKKALNIDTGNKISIGRPRATRSGGRRRWFGARTDRRRGAECPQERDDGALYAR